MNKKLSNIAYRYVILKFVIIIFCVKVSLLKKQFNGGNINMKKRIFVGLVILLSSFGTMSLASQLLKWGGEEDVAAIHEAIVDLDSKLSNKETQLLSTKDSMSQLTQTLNATQVEYQTAQSQYQALLAEKENQTDELKWLESEIARLQSEKDTDTHELASLREKMERRRIEAMDRENVLAEQLAHANEAILTIEEDIKGYHSTIETLEKESKALSDEIAQVKNEKLALVQENQQLKTAKSDSDEKLAEALREIKELRAFAEETVDKHE